MRGAAYSKCARDRNIQDEAREISRPPRGPAYRPGMLGDPPLMNAASWIFSAACRFKMRHENIQHTVHDASGAEARNSSGCNP